MATLSDIRKRLEKRRATPVAEVVPVTDQSDEREEVVSVVDDIPVYTSLGPDAPTWVSMVEGITGIPRQRLKGLQGVHWARHCDAVRAFVLEAERSFKVSKVAIPEFKKLTDQNPIREVWNAYFRRCTSLGRVTAPHAFLLTVAGTTADQLKEKYKVLDAEVSQASAEGGTLEEIIARLTTKERAS